MPSRQDSDENFTCIERVRGFNDKYGITRYSRPLFPVQMTQKDQEVGARSPSWLRQWFAKPSFAGSNPARA